ncbi:MAG: ABC transporter permease subunit, partial [Dehalococcoidia bacterium]|nr:ABC transporter permease subunit [Dehalococcoidia bacterium]
SDPRVFIQVEYLSFAPIILMMYGVLSGTGLMAGDEGRRTLEPLMAQPVSRSTIFVSRVAGLFAGLAGIYLLNLAGWLTTAPFIDLGEVGTRDLLAVTAASLPVTAAFTGLAILVAAISPARGVAAGIVSGLAVISYLLASFAQTVEAIAWMRWLSPYYYSNSHGLLTDGVVWWQQGLLVALALLAFGLAWLAFRGREIEAGVWQPRALGRGWRDLVAG